MSDLYFKLINVPNNGEPHMVTVNGGEGVVDMMGWDGVGDGIEHLICVTAATGVHGVTLENVYSESSSSSGASGSDASSASSASGSASSSSGSGSEASSASGSASSSSGSGSSSGDTSPGDDIFDNTLFVELGRTECMSLSSNPYALAVSGNEEYILGFDYNTESYSHEMTTAGDIDTLTSIGIDETYLSTIDSNVDAVHTAWMDSTGMKLLVAGTYDGHASIMEFAFGLAGENDSLSFVRETDFTTAITTEAAITGFDFNDDGTKLFVIGYKSYQIETYTLSEAYNPATALTSSEVSIDLSTLYDYLDNNLDFRNVRFGFYNGGTTLLLYLSNYVYGVELGTAYNVSTIDASSFVFLFGVMSSSSVLVSDMKVIGNTLYILYIEGSLRYFHTYSMPTTFTLPDPPASSSGAGSASSASGSASSSSGASGSGSSGLTMYDDEATAVANATNMTLYTTTDLDATETDKYFAFLNTDPDGKVVVLSNDGTEADGVQFNIQVDTGSGYTSVTGGYADITIPTGIGTLDASTLSAMGSVDNYQYFIVKISAANVGTLSVSINPPPETSSSSASGSASSSSGDGSASSASGSASSSSGSGF